MQEWKRTATLSAFCASALLAGPAVAHAEQDLAIAAQAGAVSCQAEVAANVEIDAAVTSTAAAPFTILVSTGGGFTSLGVASNWTSYGPTKGAEETLEVPVPADVATPVTICVAQPGANGNGARQACTVVVVNPSCGGTSGTGLV